MLKEKKKLTKKTERKTEEKIKERKMMKSRKGITLIALIITIIVLLILAGVSLSLVVGDNGVLNQAEKSAKRTNEEEAKEQVGMELAGSYDESGYVNLTTLNNNLRNNLEEKVEIKEEKDGTVTYKELTEENEIEELPKTVKYKGVDVELDGNTGPRYLVDKVEIGDYVDIKLPYSTNYTNNYSFSASSTYVETKQALTGWRVLSKEGEGASGTVKLISAGCPLTYYHKSGDSSKSIPNLEDLNKEINLVTSGTTGFMGQGFTAENSSEGNKVNLKDIFEKNTYIDISKGVHAFGCSTHYNGNNGTKTEKYEPINEVEQLYKEITGEETKMDNLYGSYTVSTKNLKEKVKEKWKEKWTDLFAIGQCYWLGGASYSEDYLWLVDTIGDVDYSLSNMLGVRPVVSLRSGVEVTGSGSNKGMSSDTAYQLK